MSRSGYSDDYDGDGIPLEFYRRAVDNAIAGKRGQKFMRDLLESMDAMPAKRLIADDLKTKDGEVCALGALGLARGLDMSKLDPDDAYRVAPAFGIAECLAREVVYENDENGVSEYREATCRRCHGWGEEVLTQWGRTRAFPCRVCNGRGRGTRRIKETPEQRFKRMREWVESNIRQVV